MINNKGLSLVEVLVAMIVGSIMVATMYFSFTVFSGTYLGIIAKVQVSKYLRNSLTAVSKDVRLAGYTSTIPSQSGVLLAAFPTMPNKIIIRKGTYWNTNNLSYSSDSSSDVLDVIYDQDRERGVVNSAPTRVRVSYALARDDNLINPQTKDSFFKKRLTKCLTPECYNDNDHTYSGLAGFYDYQIIAGQGLEAFKVTPFSSSGVELPSSLANQAAYLRIAILFSSISNGDVHKTNQTQTFIVGDLRVDKTDKFFRDGASVLIYPRNIK